MTGQTTADRVAAIIKDHLGLPETPAATDSLRDDLGGDSLDDVEVALAIEEAFQVEVHDPEIATCSTVGDWAALATRKAGRAG